MASNLCRAWAALAFCALVMYVPSRFCLSTFSLCFCFFRSFSSAMRWASAASAASISAIRWASASSRARMRSSSSCCLRSRSAIIRPLAET